MANVLDKTVAVITTGGTIGAVFGKGVTTLNHDSKLLKLHIEALSKNMGLDLNIYAPLHKFSEDMSPADWGSIMAAIEKCRQHNIKQIIVTHGTDTLAYSAMAASLYYSQSDLKICFTCAFYPPSAPQSDAAANIEAALAVVSSDLPPDVYIAFSRSDKDVAIARAQDVAPVAADKTLFEPLYGELMGSYDLPTQNISRRKAADARKLSAGSPAPSAEQLARSLCKVVQLGCYPGVSLTDLSLAPDKENLVILKAYHSGTMPALALRKELLTLKKTQPQTKVVLSMHPFRHVQAPYETTANLAKEGALTVYKDLLPHQIYTLAVCETSKGKSLDTVLKMIEPWRF